MDAPTATVIAASIAGVIALLSTTIAFLNMRKQMQISQHEAHQNREHQWKTTSQQRSVSAVEDLWVSMYQLQKTQKLTVEIELKTISSLVWVSTDIRNKVGAVLQAYGSGDATARRNAIIVVQDSLLDFTKSLNIYEVSK